MEKIQKNQKNPKKRKHKEVSLTKPLVKEIDSDNLDPSSKQTITVTDWTSSSSSAKESMEETQPLRQVTKLTKHKPRSVLKPKIIKPASDVIRRHTEGINRALSPKIIPDDFKENMNKLGTVLETNEVVKRKKNKRKAAQKSSEPGTVQINEKNSKKAKKHLSPVKLDDSGGTKASSDLKTIAKESSGVTEDPSIRYPVLKDEELIKRFRNVTMTNNQKGRIRQTLKEIFEGTPTEMLPDIIYNKIQYILRHSSNLTDTELRKIRVLFNMLKVAAEAQKPEIVKTVTNTKDSTEAKAVKGKAEKKEKPPKRYVVFVGNLPENIDKETILNHFSELKQYIKDVRIPPVREGKKSAIAYVELANEPSYEMALSKHHSMLCNKRINVLYSTQKNSKISKAEAKSKSAKLVALVKSGQLLGSRPLKKKRSQRRAKLRQALKANAKD